LSGSRQSLSKLSAITVLLNSADAWFTVYALNGGASEINPLVDLVLSSGFVWFLFFKLVVVNLLIVMVALYGKKYPLVCRVGLTLVAWVYSLIVLWHVTNLGVSLKTDNGF